MKYLSIFSLISFVGLSGCSFSTTDVRLTLCENLTIEMLGQSTQFEWISNDIIFKGYEDLEVKLQYRNNDDTGLSSCFYSYDTIDENAMTQSDPASAYSTYPNKMLLNGNLIDHKLLASTINSILINQGKAVFNSETNLK